MYRNAGESHGKIIMKGISCQYVVSASVHRIITGYRLDFTEICAGTTQL